MRAALSDRCRYSAPGLTRAIELCYNHRLRDARHIAMAQPVVRQPDNRWLKAVHAGLYASFDLAAAPASHSRRSASASPSVKNNPRQRRANHKEH